MSTASAAPRAPAPRGVAISFCDTEERAYLSDIERLIGRRVPVAADHPFRAAAPQPQAPRRRAA